MQRISEDETDRRILYGASTSPKTPMELSRIFGIPIAFCYQRLHVLESQGKIRNVLTVVNRKGKILKFYEAQPGHPQPSVMETTAAAEAPEPLRGNE